MKTLITKALVVLCLVAGTGVANAQNRVDFDRGFSRGSIEWRLGDARGANRGHEILYREPGSRRWQVAPGSAVAVADGWVLGTDRHRGGYGIFRWNGHSWDRAPGYAVEIGGSYRQPWVINDSRVRYIWNGYDWQRDTNARNDRYERDNRRDRDTNYDRNNRRDRYDRGDNDNRRRRGNRRDR